MTRTLCSLVFCLVLVLLSVQTLAQAPAEKPSSWIDLDPASLTESAVWRAPHTKGDHFFGAAGVLGNACLATLGSDHAFDPLWNLRWTKEQGALWEHNDLRFVERGEGWITDQPIGLESTIAPADLVQGEQVRWSYTHSPFAGLKPRALRFRRSALPGAKTTTTRTQVLEYAGGVDSARVLFEVPNLADSPRYGVHFVPSDDGMRAVATLSLRRFPASGVAAELQVWHHDQLAPQAEEQWALRHTWSDADFPILSKPHWVNDGPSHSSLVVLKAKTLTKDRHAYIGDLVSLSYAPDKGFHDERVLLASITMPVETAITPIQSGRDGTIVLVKEDQGARQLVLLRRNDDDSYRVGASTKALKGLKGFWPRYDLSWEALCGDRVVRVMPDGSLQAHTKFTATLTEVQGVRVMPGATGPTKLLLIGQGSTTTNTPRGSGFDFTILKPSAEGLLSANPATRLTRADLVKNRVPASWIAENTTSAKDIKANLRRGGFNTVMAYQCDLRFDNKKMQNKNGQVLEIYRRRKNLEQIRIEHNLSNKWLIQTFDGKAQWMALEKDKHFVKRRGEGSELINQQRIARKLLLLTDVRERGAGAFVFMGRETLRDPGNPDAEPVPVVNFYRRTAEGEEALYSFAEKAEHHDLIRARMRFVVGEEVGQTTLWFSAFRSLPSLNRRRPGKIRIPGRIRGYDGPVMKFEMTFLSEIKRATARRPIRCGFDWSEVDPKDFSESFSLD